MKRILTLLLVLLPCLLNAATQTDSAITPDGTYMFAQRDTCELYMDIYEPAEGSDTTYNGKQKPAILFVFGGGFISGTRDDEGYLPWYKMLTEEGYRVIAIDYRLGLKGVESVGVKQVDILDEAIHMAVEDLFSATAFIIDNAETLGIDPNNIVISGSSAGAITVLQAEWELCNRTSYTSVLPKNFQYAGILSFAGAVLSRDGKLDFAEPTCPILLFHGTKDKLVNYKQIKFFKLGFFGSSKIAERLKKYNFNYNIRRYEGHQHEIANIMSRTVPEQTDFIQKNILDGLHNIVDITIPHDSSITSSGSQSRKELYGK